MTRGYVHVYVYIYLSVRIDTYTYIRTDRYVWLCGCISYVHSLADAFVLGRAMRVAHAVRSSFERKEGGSLFPFIYFTAVLSVIVNVCSFLTKGGEEERERGQGGDTHGHADHWADIRREEETPALSVAGSVPSGKLAVKRKTSLQCALTRMGREPLIEGEVGHRQKGREAGNS